MSDNDLQQPTKWRQISGWIKFTNGQAVHVVTTTADRIGYSYAAQRNSWPTLGSQSMDFELWQTFLLYHAAVRLGHYSGSWEQFVNTDCEVVQPDEQGDEVDPTQPTQPSGYSSP